MSFRIKQLGVEPRVPRTIRNWQTRESVSRE